MHECIWFDEVPPKPWKPGWCFPLGQLLSNNYLTNIVSVRPPISVVVPERGNTTGTSSSFICIDSFPESEPDGHWDIEVHDYLIDGERAKITVNPSLDIPDCYHGFLKFGYLLDDIGF